MSSWVSSFLRGNNDNTNEPDNKDSESASSSSSSSSSNTQSTMNGNGSTTAEEIRKKRLAHLASLESLAKEKSVEDHSNVAMDSTNTPKKDLEKMDDNISKSNENMAKCKSSSNPKLNLTSGCETKTSRPSSSSTTSTSTSSQKLFSQRNPLDEMIKSVLRVTLMKNDKESYLYLEEYVQQLEAQGTSLDHPIWITAENVGEIFYTTLALAPSFRPSSQRCTLDYLIQCFERGSEEMRTLVDRKGVHVEEMRPVLSNIIEFCVNYSCTALTEPEMFPHDENDANLDHLVVVLCRSNGLPLGYLEALARSLKEEGQLDAIFGEVFMKLVSGLLQLRPGSIMAQFYPNLSAIASLCKIKAIATCFTSIQGFMLYPGSPWTGNRLQQATAFGIMLGFSTDNPDPSIARMFTNPTKRTRIDVDNSLNLLRSKLTMLHDVVYQIMNSILKAGPEARNKVVEWLMLTMEVNTERIKQNPNMMISSSHGFFLNLTSVLLQLCGPFLDPSSSKKMLIIPNFLLCDSPIFPNGETKLLVSMEEDQEQDSSKENAIPTHGDGQFNFITQCYFITARSVHLGPIAVIQQYMKMMHQLSYLQNRIATDPQAQVHFDRIISVKLLLDAKLLQPSFLFDLVRFAILSADFISRLCISESNLGNETNGIPQISLPLSTPPPSILCRLPQHFVEDALDILVFAGRFQSSLLDTVALDNLMSFMLIFLASPDYLHSPHLRAKMSSVMFEIFLPSDELVDGRTLASVSQGVHLLVSHPLAQEHLAPSLLALYGEVEQTGFYEKLEHRYNIACLLRFLWKHEQHKKAFHKISQDTNRFVRFANGLMNHINGLVTDALTNLPEIKLLQEEMADSTVWMQYDATTQEEKQSRLSEKERTVTSSLQLANETIHMMSYLTSEIQEPFMRVELLDRLASMLNSVLMKLAGPKGLDLKVANPEAYKFRPKLMLQEIVETLLHFAPYKEFQKAVAMNGFYNENILKKTCSILQRIRLLPDSCIAKLEQFILDVSSLANEHLMESDVLGDIPEEFLDPLMCTLMKDPVILPTSGYIIDRGTITQHLLNDETDPFTRAPLTADKLVPNKELKDRIEEWLREHAK